MLPPFPLKGLPDGFEDGCLPFRILHETENVAHQKFHIASCNIIFQFLSRFLNPFLNTAASERNSNHDV